MSEHKRLNSDNIVYDQIHNERVRAHIKHGANCNSREDATWDDKEWLPILVEEIGEVAHCMTYDAYEGSVNIDDLRDELVQVAAMAVAWVIAIDETINSTDSEDSVPTQTA